MIGWREFIALPDLGIASMRAKVDTGARTSALHAEHQEVYEADGRMMVRFVCPDIRHGTAVECPLADMRDIKNTSGIPERRLVISTRLILGRRRWRIDLSLADRRDMTFDIILGRTAIRRHGLMVDPGRSYLAGQPRRGTAKKRKDTA